MDQRPAGEVNEPPIREWVRVAAQLPAETNVDFKEEPHCPDPTCPLRRTVMEWADEKGQKHRAVVVKPLVYVRKPDVERALQLGLGAYKS